MAVNLEKKASVTITIATPRPTRRAATPVMLTSETLREEMTMVGSVTARAESNIPRPLTLTMP